MGAIAFRDDGWFEAGDAARAEASASGSSGTTMYMKLLMPVIECGVGGEELPFSFDTGASGTNLTERYSQHFRELSASWKKGKNKSAGAGGIVTRTIYLQSELRLAVGDRTATLHNVPIFTQPMGSDLDELYGNLGQDMVGGSPALSLTSRACGSRWACPCRRSLTRADIDIPCSYAAALDSLLSPA